MKKLILALVAFLAVACGTAQQDRGIINGNSQEEQLQEDIENAAVFGQTQEAINIGNGGYGFTNAASQLRCAQPGLSGQVCFSSAAKKTATYCFTGSPAMTNTDKAVVDQVLQGLNVQTNFHFNMSSFPCDIVFQQSADQSGKTTANVENFMTASPSGTVQSLTSPAGTGHVNGSWKSFNGLSVVLKLTKLSIVAAPPRAQEILRHMAGHAGALYMGNGTQESSTSQGINSPTRRVVDLDGTIGTPGVLTAGEVCRANNLAVGTPTQITQTASCTGF